MVDICRAAPKLPGSLSRHPKGPQKTGRRGRGRLLPPPPPEKIRKEKQQINAGRVLKIHAQGSKMNTRMQSEAKKMEKSGLYLQFWAGKL